MAEEQQPMASITVANQPHAREPTAAEAAAWLTIADVLQWVEMLGEASDADVPAGSVLTFIGAPPIAHWRAPSTISEAEFGEALTTWTIAGSPPTLWQRALAKLAGKAARIARGTELRSEVKANNAQAALVIQLSHT